MDEHIWNIGLEEVHYTEYRYNPCLSLLIREEKLAKYPDVHDYYHG